MRHLRSTLLPAPEPPMTVRVSPLRTSSDRSSNTTLGPKALCRPSKRISGSSGAGGVARAVT